MVKTSFFNGIKLPSIAVWDSETNNIEIIKQFSYDDYENRLS
jgi:carboxynorspermidine decarboxylase